MLVGLQPWATQGQTKAEIFAALFYYGIDKDVFAPEPVSGV